MSDENENGTKEGAEDNNASLKLLVEALATIREIHRDRESLGRKTSVEHDRVTSMEGVRKRMVQNMDTGLGAYLRNKGELEHLYFIRDGDPDKKKPNSTGVPHNIFIVARHRGKCVIGARYDFDEEIISEDSVLTLTCERFTGAALEIIMDDLLDDGYTELTE